jgi:hypothetical protein
MQKFLLTSALIFSSFFLAGLAQAGSSDNVSGFVFSNNIGWISFNSIDCDTDGDGTIEAGEGVAGCPAEGATIPNYGANIDLTGLFSGYAWSDSIGWINFSPASGFPSIPNFSARVDLGGATCGGVGNVCGWARACSVFVSGCSGALKPDSERGGWDGWIKLRKNSADIGANYGITLDSAVSPSEFKGWAWGGDVVGWLSFNCLDQGVCGVSNYKVTTTFVMDINQPPVAQMSCDGSSCAGSQCNGSWSSYQSTAQPNICLYKIKNNSTDPDGTGDISVSRWYIKPSGAPDTSYVQKGGCAGICDYTIQQEVAPGNYILKLYVEDSEGLSSEATNQITIKGEIRAGFMCSLDNLIWTDCESLKVSKNQRIYLKDDPALTEYSIASEGANISSRQWENNGVSFDGSSANPSLILTQSSNPIRLTVLDSAGRSDYREHNLAASFPLPDWIEIPPTSFIIKLLAAISSFFRF